MQDKFRELCNRDILALRFFKKLQEQIVAVNSAKDAHAHDESPILGEMLDELKGRKQVSIEEDISGLPLWKHLFSAYLSFLADNNCRLLEAVADLISEKPSS